MAPSHYLNQCWLLVIVYLPENKFIATPRATILHHEFKNPTFKITATSSRDQWVNEPHWDHLLYKHYNMYHVSCLILCWVLTLVMLLDLFWYIFAFWDKWLKFFLMDDTYLNKEYHGCWWPGDTRSQVNSSHAIELDLLGYSGSGIIRVNACNVISWWDVLTQWENCVLMGYDPADHLREVISQHEWPLQVGTSHCHFPPSRWAIGGRWLLHLQSPASQDGDVGKPDFRQGHFWQCYRV